jgi:hypothetical protein
VNATLDHAGGGLEARDSPVGMVIANLNGLWSYTDLALQGMLGYAAQEFRLLTPGGPRNSLPG